MQTSALRPLTLGEVLDVAFGLYRSRFSALVTIALASQSLPLLLGVYVESAGGSSEHPFYYFGVQVLALVAATIGTAACTFLISDTYLGISSGAAEALARAMPLIGRLVMVSIMVGLLVLIGFFLVIVPGCILLGGLWVSSAVAVVESPPSASAALSRAWKLSEGFRGKVLLTMLTGLILFLVPSLALGVVAAGAGAGAVALGALVSLLQVLLYPFLYVLTTVLYYDLRVRKEGFDLELLASALQPA